MSAEIPMTVEDHNDAEQYLELPVHEAQPNAEAGANQYYNMLYDSQMQCSEIVDLQIAKIGKNEVDFTETDEHGLLPISEIGNADDADCNGALTEIPVVAGDRNVQQELEIPMTVEDHNDAEQYLDTARFTNVMNADLDTHFTLSVNSVIAADEKVEENKNQLLELPVHEAQPSAEAGANQYYNDASGFCQGFAQHPRDIGNEILCMLYDSYMQCSERVDLHIAWIGKTEVDFTEMDKQGLIPISEIDSAGLDPNNDGHFQIAFADVEEILKEDDLVLAYSRLKACRDIFQDSANASIREVFAGRSNIVLLEMIYYMGLCS